MAGPYHLFNAEHEEVAGDKALGGEMRNKADELDGYIKDMSTGEVVYPEEQTNG